MSSRPSVVPSKRAAAGSGAAAPSRDDVHAAIECLGRLAELYQERRAQLAAGVGLTDQQWGVLEEIATEHFMPSLFARKRESSAAAVSKILRQLADKGLIVATIGKDDARQRRYALSARGRKVMERLRAGREDAIREVWLALDGAGMRAFTAFGSTLIERLTAYTTAATAAARGEDAAGRDGREET